MSPATTPATQRLRRVASASARAARRAPRPLVTGSSASCMGPTRRPRSHATIASPVKLIIQIPCKNEEEFLPVTLRELPREVPGIDTVEWLVIDARHLPWQLAQRDREDRKS